MVSIIRGRPYGGTGTLWKHSISHIVKPVKTGCDMLCSTEIVLNPLLALMLDVNISRVLNNK